MIYIPANNQICDPSNGTAKELFFNGHTIVVPDVLLDKFLRYQLSFEITTKNRVNIKEAYQKALAGTGRPSEQSLKYFLPSAALLPCAKWVLMTAYFNDPTLRWTSAPGNYTCLGFWKCLQEYAAANTPILPPNENDRRMILADNVVVPSPNEQEKIQSAFIKTNNLELSYMQAGCIDIFPKLNIFKDVLTRALSTNPKANFYLALKPIVILESITYKTPPVSPGITSPVATGSEEPLEPSKQKTNLLFYIIPPVILYLLLNTK